MRKMKRLLPIGIIVTMLALVLGVGTAKALTVTSVTDLVSSGGKTITVTASASDDVISNYWRYVYDVYNKDFTNSMYEFEIGNQYGYSIEEVLAPSGWTFANSPGYFMWTTPREGSNPLSNPLTVGNTYEFVMKTPLGSQPGYQYAEGAGPGPDSVGKTLAPVPEPSSMMLLGFGLLGMVGGVVRKKFSGK